MQMTTLEIKQYIYIILDIDLNKNYHIENNYTIHYKYIKAI